MHISGFVNENFRKKQEKNESLEKFCQVSAEKFQFRV